jgi:hypothetical protein
LLISCAGPGVEPIIKDIRDNPGTGHVIQGVPFFPDASLMCGPASLAGVMGFWGRGEGLESISMAVYDKGLKGTLPIDLVLYARDKGLDARFYRGGISDLKEKTSRGVPLILLLDIGPGFFPKRHYMVALGYSDRTRSVIVNSGADEFHVMGYGELLRAWEKTDFSTILIIPKGLAQ